MMNWMRLHMGKLLVATTVVLSVISVLFATGLLHYYRLYKEAGAFPDNGHVYLAQNEKLLDDQTGRNLVLFGDSRVEGWQPSIQISRLTTINRGISGETTAQMIHRYKADVVSLKPKVIVIQAGINDIVTAGLIPARSREILKRLKNNLNTLIDDGMKSGATVILLTVIYPNKPPLYREIVWSPLIDDYVTEINAFILAMSNTERVLIVDANAVLGASPSAVPSQYALDTLHLKRGAYERLNDTLRKLIEINAIQ